MIGAGKFRGKRRGGAGGDPASAPSDHGPSDRSPPSDPLTLETQPLEAGLVDGAPDEAPPADQRRGDRRAAPRRWRASPAHVSRQAEAARHWLPRAWPYLPLAMVAAMAGASLFQLAPPSPLVALVLGVSIIGPLCLGRVHAAMNSCRFAGRIAGVGAVLIGPLFLFGLGITRWASSGGLAWDTALAALLCIAGIATAYLRRWPAMIFTAQLAIWSAVVITHGSVAGVACLLIAFVVAVLVSREQQAEWRAEEEDRQMRDRMQTRARDILADYEETRQGWFWETDRRSLLTYVSEPVALTIGIPQDRLIGQPLVRLFDLADTGQEGERTLMFHLSARSAFHELSVRAAIPGEERWWSVSGRPIYDDFDNFVGFRGSGADLTERKRSQEHASRLARYDSLTGLANRFQMSQALDRILTSQQPANRGCAVMLLDLDRFKHVNDTMGHPAGDALLMLVSQRLQRALGKAGQVGRLGGDEFQVIVPGPGDRPVLGGLAADIINTLSQPYTIEGQQVVIGASVGIAISPDDGVTNEELIRNADLALYAAKDGGRGRYHFYADDLHAEAEARAELERDLREAIARGDLQLFYQPVVSLANETISGFEALLRWEHPHKGWISPETFVQIAEDSGLIAQIGEWALRTACHDLAQWPGDVRMAVNVSPRQFANSQLPAIVTSAIAEAGLDPARLELEITESVFLNDSDGTDAMFAALKRVGVRLALDDFGTGYSALGYLKKAPFDKIKIDRSFVRGATQPGSRNGAIIASITSLARTLGMDTTAEGVETLDELDLVRRHGCTHVQGYIYEMPLSAENAARRLGEGLAAVARGPRSARAPRQTMLRKVVLDHGGQKYDATIRNLSSTGAMIEGLWNVPEGTVFDVLLSAGHVVKATARWSVDDRMGVQFATPLQRDRNGGVVELQDRGPARVNGGARAEDAA